MKKLFVNKIYNEDNSVTIGEFTELSADLFDLSVEMTADMGFCSILDTETTGLSHVDDEIIEIAIRKWIYHKKDHYLIKPVEQYSELNEPVRNSISSKISELTGILPDDVKGKRIDWEVVSSMIAESDFVLAHNAGFDRPMVEAVEQVRAVSASKVWTCSLKQVDWTKLGFLSAKQELLSVFHGFHYAGHRALTDVDALGNLLMQGDYLKEIMGNAKMSQVRVNCKGAPFDSKDLLKSRGFFWNVSERFWSKLIPDTELDAMKEFLSDEVYPVGRMQAELLPIGLTDLFKA